METNEWRVVIRKQPWSANVDMYFIRYNGGTTEVMQRDGTIMRYLEGSLMDDVKPSVLLPGHAAEELLKALAVALDHDGVKTPNDHRIVGTLDAMKEHLADLRQLLKLKGAK